MKKKNTTKLVEVAWEVCNQVGGIYTVIRSKLPSIVEKWGEDYCVVGPYIHKNVAAEFEPAENYDDFEGRAVIKMREMGFDVHYGRWMVTGKPKVILLNPYCVFHDLAKIKYVMWEHHNIESKGGHNDLLDQVIAFGYLVKKLFNCMCEETKKENISLIGHFHEWMAATCIPELRMENEAVKTVFTTHATLLGRYIAMNDPDFYEHLPYFNWETEAKKFNVETIAQIERAAAHGSHVFTTVSDVTAKECVHLLGRKPDVILPNGLNIERFVALHEFQNLHKTYKDKISDFVMGHFFHSYSFDLDNTLYFFTSGRYEYKNKGFDITLEALARLNHKMKVEKINTTVVMFFITKQPFKSINPMALETRAVMQEVQQTCQQMMAQVGEKMFEAVASSKDNKLPNLNDFIDEYWKLRLRRTLQSWHKNTLPLVVTHNLYNDSQDEILNFVRTSNLVNHQDDPVKIVYHPDFVSATNPLFGMDYGQFVRGCHLGVFPSYYEPWGYTPLECIASGVPTITSDLSGFGDYVIKTMPDREEHGIFVTDRTNKNFHESADQLCDQMLKFIKLNRRERITLRNKTESSSHNFDWQYLTSYYNKAYDMALNR